MTRRHLLHAIPLAAIVLLGIELRLLFAQGVIHTDDLFYAHLARQLAEGLSPFVELLKQLPDKYAALRIGIYGPAAILYLLFGTSDVTTLAWPFLLSIAGILGAYGIGRLAHGEGAGLLAAFMVAVLPTNVAAATALMGDGPMAAFSIGVVFFLVLSGRLQGGRSLAAIVASLVCFGLGLLCKPAILLLLPFYIIYVVGQLKRSMMALTAAGLALAAALIGYLLYFGLRPRGVVMAGPGMLVRRLALTATDAWSQLVVGLPEFSWLAPLAIVALVALIAWRRTEARVVMLWLACTFLYGELGSRTLVTYTPIVWYDAATPGRHFLFIAAPAAILVAIYLAQGLKDETARRVVTVCAVITAVVAWIGSRGATNINWHVAREAPEFLPFVRTSGIATIVVVFGGLASPAFLRSDSVLVRAAASASLAIAIGLASLQHSYRAGNEFKNAWVDTLPEAERFLAAQPPLPIVMQNEMQGQRLDYVSHFALGFRSAWRPFVQNPRIVTGPADVAGVPADAYVLIDQQMLQVSIDQESIVSERRAPAYFFNPPPRWVKIQEFGKYPGSQLKIYRVSSRSAAEELALARAALKRERSASTLLQLLNTAVAAGEYCEAATVWFDLRAAAPEEIASFEPVQMLAECYKVNQSGAGPNLFLNADFSQGLDSWAKHPDSDATVQAERDRDGVPLWHGIYRGNNWAIISQPQILQPNTVYVQEADIKTTGPVVPLYWQWDVGRFLSIESTYPEWTHLQYVFITPPGVPTPVGFHPVLMKAPGEVWLKNLRLSVLGPPKLP